MMCKFAVKYTVWVCVGLHFTVFTRHGTYYTVSHAVNTVYIVKRERKFFRRKREWEWITSYDAFCAYWTEWKLFSCFFASSWERVLHQCWACVCECLEMSFTVTAYTLFDFGCVIQYALKTDSAFTLQWTTNTLEEYEFVKFRMQ